MNERSRFFYPANSIRADLHAGAKRALLLELAESRIRGEGRSNEKKSLA